MLQYCLWTITNRQIGREMVGKQGILSLILLLCISLASCQVDLSTRLSVGSVTFKGTKLNVFEVDGIQFAEPNIQFAQSCGTTTFNHVYLKYQVSVSLLIDADALEKPIGGDSKRVGKLTILKLKAEADNALGDYKSNVTLQLQMENAREAQLLLLCDDFYRCESLRAELLTNPNRLQRAIEFSATGAVESGGGGLRVKFGGQISSNPPPITDCRLDRWIVFQRRVDGSLSFAQTWDSYVKGFGNQHSNYWMGLDQLFVSTVSSEHNGHGDTSRCRMRVECMDLMGNSYWGEYNFFQVMSPDQNYRVRLQGQVIGSNVEQVTNMHERQFSTYDKHNSGCPGNACSRHYGYAGWWFPGAYLNANAAYPTDGQVFTPTYMSAIVHGKYVAMRNMVLMFKCAG